MSDILSAKKFIEAIVNSIDDPIIGLNTEREILFINDEALSILNMKRENVIRKSAEELSLKNDLLRRLIRELVTPSVISRLPTFRLTIQMRRRMNQKS